MGSFPLHSPSTASFHMRWSGHYTFDMSERALVRRSCCWILAAIADVLSRRAFSDAVRGRSRQCACISYIQQTVHARVLCMLCVHSRFRRAGLCACFDTSSVLQNTVPFCFATNSGTKKILLNEVAQRVIRAITPPVCMSSLPLHMDAF